MGECPTSPGLTPRTRRFAVARRWRLRNKLLLGLGLMLACVVALISGSGYGLNSNMGAMKTTSSKLDELLTLDQLKPDVAAILAEPIPVAEAVDKPAIDVNPAESRTGEVRRAKQKLEKARGVFDHYKTIFDETVR